MLVKDVHGNHLKEFFEIKKFNTFQWLFLWYISMAGLGHQCKEGFEILLYRQYIKVSITKVKNAHLCVMQVSMCGAV